MRELAWALRGLWWRRGTSAALLGCAVLCVATAVVGPLYAVAEGQRIVHDTVLAAGASRTAVQDTVDATATPGATAALARRLPTAGSTPGYPDRFSGLAVAADTYLPLSGGRSGHTVLAARSDACLHLVVTGRCPQRAGEVLVGAATAGDLSWPVGTVLAQQRGYGRTPLTVVGTYRAPTDTSRWAGLPVAHGVQALLTDAATLDHPWQAGPVRTAGSTPNPLTALTPTSTATCAELRVTAGRCPTGSDQAMLSVRTAAALGVRPGGTITVPVSPSGTPVTVVGLYLPRDPTDDFWRQPYYLDPRADLVVLDPGTWSESALQVTGSVTMPLRLSDVDTLTPDQLRRSATELTARVGRSTSATTGIFTVLDRADRDVSGLRSLTVLVVGELLLLTWFVLYLVVAGASEAQGNELALARLRGLRAGRTVRFGLTGPVVLLLLALPLGVLLAEPVGAALSGRAVPPGPPALLAALLAVAGGLVAVVLAARGVLTRPVLEQWRSSGGDRAGLRAATPADGIVVALAVAGLVELRSGGTLRQQDAGLTLLAPLLVALAVAVIGVRLLPLACRSLLRVTRGSPHVGRFVALRQLARRPAGLRLAALLAVTVALAFFAAGSAGVAARNRDLRARAEIGAARVLTVTPRADLVEAVRRADPTGRYAMAVTIVPGNSGLPGLLAVDTTRLTRVPFWLGAYGGNPATLGRELRPTGPGSTPRALPVISTTGAEAAFARLGEQTDETTGLDGRSVSTTDAGTVRGLPVLGTDAQLADLSTAEALVTATGQLAGASRAQVWLAAGTPAAVLSALDRQGIDVQSQTSVADRTATLQRQGPALGLRLLMVAALFGTVLAAVATALSTGLSARRRSYELATLSLLAYPRRSLLAAAVGEQALLLLTGLLLGVLGGLAGSRLALSALPYYSDTSPLPLQLDLPYARIGLLVLALAVLLAVVGGGSALLLVGAARPSRLREAP